MVFLRMYVLFQLPVIMLIVLFNIFKIDQTADIIFENFPSVPSYVVVTGLPVNAGHASCNRNSAKNLWCQRLIAWTVKITMRVRPM